MDNRKSAIRDGVELARKGRYKDALLLLEKDLNFTYDPVAMSCYAMLIATMERQFGQALSYCQIALNKDPRNAEILLNMGKVYLMNGNKYFAIRTFNKGLTHNPGHKGLSEVFMRLGIRRRPTLPFLPRDNFMNKYIGIATYNLGSRFKR